MRGRKPKTESQATEIRTKLASWKQTPEYLRPSLRDLARQMGTSHQLLTHYLQRLEKWQANECDAKAKQVRAGAESENRYLTAWEAQQAQAYDREGIRYLLDFVLGDALRKWEKEIKQDVKAGRSPAAGYWKLLRKVASRGNRQAQGILAKYFKGRIDQATNNLPLKERAAAKSFRSRPRVRDSCAARRAQYPSQWEYRRPHRGERQYQPVSGKLNHNQPGRGVWNHAPNEAYLVFDVLTKSEALIRGITVPSCNDTRDGGVDTTQSRGGESHRMPRD